MRCRAGLVVAALLLSSCATGEADDVADGTAQDSSTDTPAAPEPFPIVDAARLHSPDLDAVIPELHAAALEAVELEEADLDEADLEDGQLYRWGVSHLDMFGEGTYDPKFESTPSLITVERGSAAFDALIDEEATFDAQTTLETRILQDSESDGATDVVRGYLRLEVELYPDAGVATERVNELSSDTERLDAEFLTSPEFDVLGPLEDPRVLAASSERAVTVDTGSPNIEDGLVWVGRDVAVGNLVVSLDLIGRNTVDLDRLSRETTAVVLDGLSAPYEPVPAVVIERRAGDAESRLGSDVWRRVDAIAELPDDVRVVPDEELYRYSSVVKDDGTMGYGRQGGDPIIFDRGTELANSVLQRGALAELADAGMFLDSRRYRRGDPDGTLLGRISVVALTFDGLQDASLVFDAAVTGQLRVGERIEATGTDRFTESAVVQLEGVTPGDAPAADGLTNIAITGRVANMYVRLEVAGTVGVEELRALAEEMLAEVLDAYDVP